MGVSANAAYRHFADRHELVLAIALEAPQRLAHHLAVTMGSTPPDGSPADLAARRLCAFGLGYLGFALDERSWYDLACYTQHAPDDATPILDDAAPGPTPHEMLLDALDDLVGSGVLAPSRRVGAEWVCWAVIQGLTDLATIGPLQGTARPELDQLAASTFETVISGLQA